MRNDIRRHKRNIFQFPAESGKFLLRNFHLLFQVAGNIILQLDHQKRADSNFGFTAFTAQNRGYKKGQTHWAEIDILTPKALRFRHAVDMRLDAVFMF